MKDLVNDAKLQVSFNAARYCPALKINLITDNGILYSLFTLGIIH